MVRLGRRGPRSDRCVVAVVADGHAGHRLGLIDPEGARFLRTDGRGREYWHEVNLLPTNLYLWDLYTTVVAEAVELAAGDPLVLVYNGDPTQGTRVGGVLPITPREQVEVAARTLWPWLGYPGLVSVRVMSGTAVHVRMGHQSSGVQVAAELRAKRPGLDVKSGHHGRLTVLDRVLDVSHHGPSKGIRKWLEGNNARYYLRDAMMQDHGELGLPPADVYLRAHYHVWVLEWLTMMLGGREYTSCLNVTPSVSGVTSYARKQGKSPPYVVNGISAVEVVRGRPPVVHRLTRTQDLRDSERLV